MALGQLLVVAPAQAVPGSKPVTAGQKECQTSLTRWRTGGVSVTDAEAGSLLGSGGSTFTWALASLAEGPPWAPFLINYGVPAEEWPARLKERGFPIDPWSLDHLVVETSDPAASAGWLAGVLGLPVVQVGRGAVGVPLPGCTIGFARGSADRITRVVLAGADAPVGEVAGLYYRRATP